MEQKNCGTGHFDEVKKKKNLQKIVMKRKNHGFQEPFERYEEDCYGDEELLLERCD